MNTNPGLSYLGYVPPSALQTSMTAPGSSYLGAKPFPLNTSGVVPSFKQSFYDITGIDSPLGKEPVGKPQLIDEPSSAGGVASSGVEPNTLDYLNAEYAKHYGMDRNTAYQEALSNTAYQRAVKDMKDAGLNPASIFGSGKGYTAGGVGYVGSESSGSAHGYSNQDKEYAIDSGLYHGIATIAGLAASALTKSPMQKVSAYWIASASAKGAMGAFDSLLKKFG